MPRVSQEQAKLNRQRVVEVASSLFRERGLNGIGVVDIMAAAGLTHGGFYGQFANKEALAAEAFDAAIRDEYEANLDAFIENYLSLGHVRTPGRGCPVAALVSDIGREPAGSALRSRFTHAVKGLAGLIADRLPKATKERRRQRALIALSTMVGAVVLARGVDDEALADELLTAARSTIAG
ncbi:TetR family transcriptional regulator [Methylobacterium sp. Leaf123]|jgi:TetR/AcrR family transcriptional regulator, transcriptional repressor for nem operon|uniref:TetR family transcriptional regulator n=1 Tax=Methylobacterium sp. Leaf123 TaxID=1736264 RepID=UPI0006F90FE8|nr:TetR family transcriptional regulator [Methylobacterium sp. Leaf123]KQQ17633.1 TetR family transcriptional regulator [Methylobacterium sp. Leaf123]